MRMIDSQAIPSGASTIGSSGDAISTTARDGLGIGHRHRRVVCGMASPQGGWPSNDEALPVRFETADAWLNAAVDRLVPIFHDADLEVPPLRIHLGWTSRGLRTRRIGECWPRGASQDGVATIFITTQMESPASILDVLMHEMVHAVDDCAHQHGKEFVKIAKQVGLVGPPWRSSGAGELLRHELSRIARHLGHLPYSPLKTPAPATREMRSGRVMCPQCGFACRTLSEWSASGTPWCPEHHTPLIPDWKLAESLSREDPESTDIDGLRTQPGSPASIHRG